MYFNFCRQTGGKLKASKRNTLENILSLDPVQSNKEVWYPIEIQNVYDMI